MHAKKGFTLIELLVVIAIIAILAAILFPVFANARDKARQISGLSNHKQVALAIIMYSSDYDDTFPIGQCLSSTGYGWFSGITDNTDWVLGIAPYVGSTAVFYGPNDTASGQEATVSYADWGKKISLGVNSLQGQDVAGNTGKEYRLGIFSGLSDFNTGTYSATAATWDMPNGNGPVCKISEITQPAATILTCDLSSSDIAKIETSANVRNSLFVGMGNPSSFTAVSLIGNSFTTSIWTTAVDAAVSAGGWGTTNAVNDEMTQFNTNYYDTTATGWSGFWAIPNPARVTSNPYPAGPNGMVSAPYSKNSLANFTFADGHAKAMHPAATNDSYNDTCWGTTSWIANPNCMWLVNR